MPYKDIAKRRIKNKEWKLANPDKVAAQQKRHREKYRDKLNNYNSIWHKNHPEYDREWRHNNPDKMVKSFKSYQQRLHDTILSLLGNKCCKCQFSDPRVLQIDHINGDGRHERHLGKGKYYKKVIESILNQEGKYQLLCANCNWIKRVENKEYFKHKE